MSELSDEDKRLADEMRRRQRERREYIANHGRPPEGVIATAPADPDKHADAIGLDDRGQPFPLTPRPGDAAAVVYRDDAHGFSVVVPGSPQPVAPGDSGDAAYALLGGALRLRLRVRGRAATTAAAAEVTAVARGLIDGAPVERTFRQPGVTAAAMGSRLDGGELLEVDVLGGASALATLTLRYDARAVDPATAATVRGAIVASVAFGAVGERDVTALWPDSPWLEPGLPLRLRGDRPAVPAVADRARLAGELLGVLGPVPPAWTLRSEARGAVEGLMAAAVGTAAAEPICEQLTTAHDVRGLALAILRG